MWEFHCGTKVCPRRPSNLHVVLCHRKTTQKPNQRLPVGVLLYTSYSYDFHCLSVSLYRSTFCISLCLLIPSAPFRIYVWLCVFVPVCLFACLFVYMLSVCLSLVSFRCLRVSSSGCLLISVSFSAFFLYFRLLPCWSLDAFLCIFISSYVSMGLLIIINNP